MMFLNLIEGSVFFGAGRGCGDPGARAEEGNPEGGGGEEADANFAPDGDGVLFLVGQGVLDREAGELVANARQFVGIEGTAVHGMLLCASACQDQTA